MKRVCAIALFASSAFAAGQEFEQQQSDKPQVILKGTVNDAQNHQFIRLPFTVPAGVHRITVEIHYTDREKQTVLNTEISDPVRFRGTSGSNKNHFTIGESDATPSYLPGAIPAGVWMLAFGVSNIRKGMTSSYEADIRFDRSIDDSSFTEHPLETGARWYRGDLHMHTAHSDGTCASQSGRMVPCPVFSTVEAAAKRGLDFIAVTDHNSTAQSNSLRELQPYFDKLLFIPGREVTTFAGHTNVYGTMRYLDYHVGDNAVPDTSALARQAQELGGILSINHADEPGGEVCRGCRWEPNPPVDMHLISAVEVINGGDGEGYFPSYKFWQTQLEAGYRPTAIGGSDNHRSDWALQHPGSVGSPTTVVYARDLSVAAILEGIRAGHVFIDLTGSPDRILEVHATDGNGTAAMGDVLAAKDGETVHITAHAMHCGADRVRLLVDGITPLEMDADLLTTSDQQVSAEWKSDGKRHWVVAEIHDQTGGLDVLGNPVYLNF
ncbi:CehA/McbA family metallohydrolase [Silvibacterium sp.]|uniref:CehA/McbA family metallohydrolase n=1 Tax=Silvibacterium sp. TaxID=1964179 RepID=UPI0039E49E2D